MQSAPLGAPTEDTAGSGLFGQRLKPVPVNRRQPVGHDGQALLLAGALHPDVGTAAADLVAGPRNFFTAPASPRKSVVWV